MGSSVHLKGIELMERAAYLLEKIDACAKMYPRIEGIGKFRTAVRAEHRFIENLVSTNSVRSMHLDCSNIPNLEAVLSVLQRELVKFPRSPSRPTPPVAVFKPFAFIHQRTGERDRVRVDVVTDSGRVWIKVKASSMRSTVADLNAAQAEADAEEEESDDDDEFDDPFTNSEWDVGQSDSSDEDENLGRPSVFDVARRLLHAATQNLVAYQVPEVRFCFIPPSGESAFNLDQRIIDGLQKVGATIEYESYAALASTPAEPASPIILLPQQSSNGGVRSPALPPLACLGKCSPASSIFTDVVNLDVTTLVLLASDLLYDLSNIPATSLTGNDALTAQYEAELRAPILPLIRSTMFRPARDDDESNSAKERCSVCGVLLVPRRAVACQTAVEKFLSILDKIGGPREKARGASLFDLSDPALDIGGPLSVLLGEDPRNLEGRNPVGVKVQVVPDTPSQAFLALTGKKLPTSPKIQDFHIKVFGTGNSLLATTITANTWIYRSYTEQQSAALAVRGRDMGEAKEGGTSLDLCVWTHDPRSLVEKRVFEVKNGTWKGRQKKKQEESS
ncbi:hypothetical protein BJ742DRAFT_821012 [Cladochytrium replicatum]|nr:hypothetical protein BJ742DRAFT_821012 [Cladochytrium replicatum]